MDKDRIEGSANQAKGAIKQGAGKLTGDAKLQAEGAADKAKGKVQNAVAAPRMPCGTLPNIEVSLGGRSSACAAKAGEVYL